MLGLRNVSTPTETCGLLDEFANTLISKVSYSLLETIYTKMKLTKNQNYGKASKCILIVTQVQILFLKGSETQFNWCKISFKSCLRNVYKLFGYLKFFVEVKNFHVWITIKLGICRSLTESKWENNYGINWLQKQLSFTDFHRTRISHIFYVWILLSFILNYNLWKVIFLSYSTTFY